MNEYDIVNYGKKQIHMGWDIGSFAGSDFSYSLAKPKRPKSILLSERDADILEAPKYQCIQI